MSKKRNTKTRHKADAGQTDQIISDLMEKRKLQQGALIKIMSSIDKATPASVGNAQKLIRKKTGLNRKKQ